MMTTCRLMLGKLYLSLITTGKYQFYLVDSTLVDRDLVTGEEPDRVEFYRNIRWNQRKGWIAPEAEENYEKMVEIWSHGVEGGKELTGGNIVEKVLGKRSGYAIVLRRAEVPPSWKAMLMYNMDEVNQLRVRTKEQEQEINELRAWKAS